MIYNFFPGPGVLFEDVMKTVQEEFRNWNNTGISIIECSHRTDKFKELLNDTKNSLRELINIPNDYEILFVQGGATQVFSSLPLNLSSENETVDYIVNGYWSKFAAQEAEKYCNVHISAHDKTYTSCPNYTTWKLTPNVAYIHYCSNETIHGNQYQEIPNIQNKNLVCDMSSDFLSKPIDVTKFGMIYAGAHKNIGPAGMTVIIIKKSLLSSKIVRSYTPYMLNYKLLMDSNSMLNTPPIFSIYFANLVFKYLIKMGGLTKMLELNKKKATLLYDVIDSSDGFYSSNVMKEFRSMMNVPFSLTTKEFEEQFIKECEQNGLIGLRGHDIVGHCRASIYNGMTYEGVEKLCALMKEFQKKSIF